MNQTILSNFLPRKVCNGDNDFEIKLGKLTYAYLNHCTLKSGLKKEYYKCVNCPARLQLLIDTQTIILTTEHENSVCIKELKNIMAAVQRQSRIAAADMHNSGRKKLDIILEESILELEDSPNVKHVAFDCSPEDSNTTIESNDGLNSTMMSEHVTMRESDLDDTTTDEPEPDSTIPCDLTLEISDDDSTLSCDLTLANSALDSLLSSSESESGDESYQTKAMEMSFVSRYGRRRNK